MKISVYILYIQYMFSCCDVKYDLFTTLEYSFKDFNFYE